MAFPSADPKPSLGTMTHSLSQMLEIVTRKGLKTKSFLISCGPLSLWLESNMSTERLTSLRMHLLSCWCCSMTLDKFLQNCIQEKHSRTQIISSSEISFLSLSFPNWLIAAKAGVSHCVLVQIDKSHSKHQPGFSIHEEMLLPPKARQLWSAF